MVERYVRDVEVAGSNPVTPIFLLVYRKALSLLALRFFFYFSILLLLYEDYLLFEVVLTIVA